VDLKRKTAEVSSGRALSIEEAARKDSAVHVSLSSDSPVKQPGHPLLGTRPRCAGGPSKLDRIRPKSDAWSPVSVRSFEVAPSRRGGGAPWRPYIGFRYLPCQHLGRQKFAAAQQEIGIAARSCRRAVSAIWEARERRARTRAALRPHSSVVLS